MKKPGFFIVLAAASFLIGASLSPAAENPPAEVLSAAKAGLPEYLGKIPLPELEEYGFEEGDVFETAVLGTPYCLHTITPSALGEYTSGTPVASIITPTTLWYFPVLVGGKMRAILLVDKLDGKWQAVSLGHAPLARELGLMEQQWKAAKGYKPVLIVVYQAGQYLFTVPQKDAVNLTPLTAAESLESKAAGSEYANLESASDVIARLKPVVQDALKESK